MRHLTMAGVGILATLFLAACDDAGDDAPVTPPADPQQSPQPDTQQAPPQ